MAMDAAERMRAYRKRRNRYGRKAGRPKKKLPTVRASRHERIHVAMMTAWRELLDRQLTEVSFRTLRRCANKHIRHPMTQDEMKHWFYYATGNQFTEDGVSSVGLPLRILVLQPE